MARHGRYNPRRQRTADIALWLGFMLFLVAVMLWVLIHFWP